MKNEADKLWDNYQKDYWTKVWSSSPYSFNEKLDSVKDSSRLSFILKYISRECKILEAGCGMGQWVVYLHELGYDIIGVDFSEPTINHLNNLFPALQFAVGDVTDLKFEDGSFNVVLSWGVVEHFKSGPLKALEEANRILLKEGFLFITVPCQNYLFLTFSPFLWVKDKIIQNKFVRKLRGKKMNKRFYQYEFRRKKIKNYVKDAGFEIIETIPISHEIGFVEPIHKLLRFSSKKRSKVFIKKNGTGKWEGLTSVGNHICRYLNKLSPWISPDQIFIIAMKK